MALHLALMLHELGTNSVKYGALSTSGWVTVSWSVTDQVLKLRWVERGGPRVAAPIVRGFGTTLIEQSAKSEGGEAQMICEAEGVTWEISLVLPQSAASALRLEPELMKEPPAKPLELSVELEAALAGRRLLVVEDEPLIALDLVDTLEKAGAEVAPPVGTERAALRLIEQDQFDAALLDANLHGRSVNEIAAALTRHNIPFIFVTGYGQEGLPEAFRRVPILAKPVSEQQLLDAVKKLVPQGRKVIRFKR
jgi:CheY-like chemotaxis protein